MEEVVEKIAEAPAGAISSTIEASERMISAIQGNAQVKQAHNYWRTLGPGLTTGAADDDPSGIATYSQAGSQYGFQLLWLAAFTFPLMAIVQEMCARIGLVTGRGLAGNIRKHYSKKVLFTCAILLFIANSLNIGADLGAMAKATQLLFPRIDFGLLVVGFTVFTLILQIFTSYARYSSYLKWLALILLAYVFSALSINLNPQTLLTHGLIPSINFTKEQIFLVCAILGTTISPYLFFWQTSQEIEEEILIGKTSIMLRTGTTKKEIRKMQTDVWSGMFLSNMVMFFIIAACAATLYAHGITNINSAADAAKALQPIAGESAYLLFAIGIIGTGLLAIPILAGSASYAISESFQWKSGLYRKLKQAPSFYGVIIFAMLIGFVMNFVGIDPIKALLYSAVANGLIAPIILILIIKISSSKKIMGDMAVGKVKVFLGVLITAIMIIAGGATLITMFL